MLTLFKSHGLWKIVEEGSADTTEATKQKDAKALFLIQRAVHREVFNKIARATTANEAWGILKTSYQGTTRVMTIKLQGLRR
jgi:gag-polypeptide of LTR copia-type